MIFAWVAWSIITTPTLQPTPTPHLGSVLRTMKETETHLVGDQKDSQESAPDKSWADYLLDARRRAQEILALLSGHVSTEGRMVLDLGCGPAPVSKWFEGSALCVGLDIERRYFPPASQRGSLNLILADARQTPFRDRQFSFVVCNDVLEHVRENVKVMKEIFRVLSDDGACYIQFAPKYQIIEHYYLPFLSWLPRPLANLYVKITGKGQSYEFYPVDRKEIFRLVSVHRGIDLTCHRMLLVTKNQGIISKVAPFAGLAIKLFRQRWIAKLAQSFVTCSILVFKDCEHARSQHMMISSSLGATHDSSVFRRLCGFFKSL